MASSSSVETYLRSGGGDSLTGVSPAPTVIDPSCPEITVVILNFNAGSFLERCVDSVLRSSVPVDVIVVDNASDDGSFETLRVRLSSDCRVRFLPLDSNTGFARGVNHGLRHATSKFVLVLNPDCVLDADTLAVTVAGLESHPSAAAAGCVLRNPDGSEQAGGRRGVPTPWRSLTRVLHLDRKFGHHGRFRSFDLMRDPLPSAPVRVEAVSGAFMLFRRSALDSIGLFDEGYFMHCEDLDWCMRCAQSGQYVLFVPGTSVVHFKGISTRRMPFRVELHKHRGMIHFYNKFFRHQYPGGLMWAVSAAVGARFASRVVLVALGRR